MIVPLGYVTTLPAARNASTCAKASGVRIISRKSWPMVSTGLPQGLQFREWYKGRRECQRNWESEMYKCVALVQWQTSGACSTDPPVVIWTIRERRFLQAGSVCG